LIGNIGILPCGWHSYAQFDQLHPLPALSGVGAAQRSRCATICRKALSAQAITSRSRSLCAGPSKRLNFGDRSSRYQQRRLHVISHVASLLNATSPAAADYQAAAFDRSSCPSRALVLRNRPAYRRIVYARGPPAQVHVLATWALAVAKILRCKETTSIRDSSSAATSPSTVCAGKTQALVAAARESTRYMQMGPWRATCLKLRELSH
jgi:hypothetical protein